MCHATRRARTEVDMTQGFYEQLGVPAHVSFDELRAAYGRAVGHLMRRRDATVQQGGNTGALDLARTQLDEAWAVLSDGGRRRRYDAMLALVGAGASTVSADDLWDRASGALLHPSVAAAAELVHATTHLGVGPVPHSPGAEPAIDAVAAAPSAFRTSRPSAMAPLPDPAAVAELRTEEAYATAATEVPATLDPLLDGPPSSWSPPTLPPPPVGATGPSEAEVNGLMEQHGPSGALIRAIRERRGLALSAVSDQTRISPGFLEAIEAEGYDALPSAPAFVRGYVQQVARLLQIEEAWLVDGYMRRMSGD